MKTKKKPTSLLNTRAGEELLQGYLFHYNPYTKYWAAFPRELVNDYFNGVENPQIIKNKNPQTIQKFLIETNNNQN